ncbi:MAG: biosynthetic peptidoglycan transglycosylase [Myxococcales bacterium]|nr:biosynthetic peptidoglycan transglycosylase [Myxococcales bacterium]
MTSAVLLRLRRALGATLVMGVGLGGLALSVTSHNLAPEARAMVAAQLGVPLDAVRLERAVLHPLWALQLDGLQVPLGDHVAGVRRLTMELDPVAALRGRARPRRLIAEQVTVARGTIERIEAVLPEGGRTRLLLSRLHVEGQPLAPKLGLHAMQVSMELHHGRVSRLAASGVLLGGLGPAGLLLRSEEDGLVLRGAMAGAHMTIEAGPGRAEANIDMDRLRLPFRLNPWVDLSDTRISGQLALHTEGPWGAPLWEDGAVVLRGAVALSDLALRHPALTRNALPHLAMLLDGELHLARTQAGLRAWTPRLSLSMGELRLSLSGELERRPDGGLRVSTDLVLDEVDCAQLLQALPRHLIPHLDGLGVRGQLGGQIHLSFDTRTLPEVDVRPSVDIGCQVIGDPPQANARTLLDDRLSIERPGADGQLRRLPLGPRAERAPGVPPFQSLRGLPWPVVRTFLVAEDNQFYQHRGFDVQMIIRALGMDLKEPASLRGASTVTQQVAKNLWLGNERALGRKLEEAVLAWRLEQVVPKERLLEVYLNLVELGSGIYGISMAAQHYFGKPPHKLTLDQAAQLAALLPAPRRGMDEAWARRYRDILHRYGTASVPGPGSHGSGAPSTR